MLKNKVNDEELAVEMLRETCLGRNMCSEIEGVQKERKQEMNQGDGSCVL